MTEQAIIISCLIAAAILPYLAKVPLAYAMYQQGVNDAPAYDNSQPRTQQQQLTGFGARCLAAHENAFEALIVFSAAACLVLATEQTSQVNAALSITFILSRVGYTLCYWCDWGTLRSLIWVVGIGSCLAMMLSCLP